MSADRLSFVVLVVAILSLILTGCKDGTLDPMAAKQEPNSIAADSDADDSKQTVDAQGESHEEPIPIVSSTWVTDNDTGPPPAIIVEAMSRFNETQHGEGEAGERRLSGNLKEDTPYIIRSKYGGRWHNCELSWDSRSGTHPRASCEFNDPVDWELSHKGGNKYRIVSQYPHAYYGAELSWDSGGRHPMASVEYHDPVDWEFAHQSGHEYRIRSLYPHSWYRAELSWDGGGSHPMVSVEYHDPVDWEVLPAYTVTGRWQFVQSFAASPGTQISQSVTMGTTNMQSWTKSETYSHTVARSAELGFEISGVSGKQSISSSRTRSVMNSVTRSISRTYGYTESRTWVATAKAKNLWQFIIEITNNHHHNKGQKSTTYTNAFELTASPSHMPQCLPGYGKFGTGAQVCLPGGYIDGRPDLPEEDCVPDLNENCHIYANFGGFPGLCQYASLAKWMSKYCHASCECGK